MNSPTYISIKEFLVNSPENDPKGVFLFAHGAGTGMASPFMDKISKGIINSGVRVVRFNFPFMEKMLRTGKRKPPNTGKVLRKCFSDVITYCIERERVPPQNIIIGGKSIGARAAAMVADNHQVAGVICLSYPFHFPKKPEKLRIKVLETVQTPTLICQGERDLNKTRDEISKLRLSSSVQINWVAKGDKNFQPINNSNASYEKNITSIIQASNSFIGQVLQSDKK